MLDVHPPERAAHTWTDFFIHIATIVVGLLIAIGLEQTVEMLHHRHQRHRLEEALRKDGEANREYIKDNIAMAQSILDWALEQATAIEHAGPARQLTMRRMPDVTLYAPDAAIWLDAKASGETSLLSASQQNWLEELQDLEMQTFVSNASSKGQLTAAYAALDQALLGHATETPSGDLDLSSLTAAQRATVVVCLRSIAERTRGVMRGLVSYMIDDEYILITPKDKLDDSNAEKQFYRITRENMNAHPALRYTFSPR